MPSDSSRILQSPLFGRKIKKIKKQDKAIIDCEIKKILKSPTIGTEKKGDLRGTWIHKFKMNTQQLLLAYQFDQNTITLLNIGSHENYYRDLKKYLV